MTTCCGSRWRSRERCSALVERVRPDHVIVDHLAFSARLGLSRHRRPARGRRPRDTPRRCTVGDEVYGYPPAWPSCLRARAGGARGPAPLVRRGPGRVHRPVERRAVRARPRCQPQRRRLRRDRRGPAPQLSRTAAPPRAHRPAAATCLPWLRRAHRAAGRRGGRPGSPGAAPRSPTSASGASSRSGVTCSRVSPRRCASSTSGSPWRPAPPPRTTSARSPRRGWSGGVLPQVTLLARARLAVTHGGNNSVTEA